MIRHLHKALLIVDVQNDFCPGGALSTPQGNKVIPVINKVLDNFTFIIASRDWHPRVSVHFNKWPEHCLQKTKGAEFPKKLNSNKFDVILNKGTRNIDDGYSAFEATNINLKDLLKHNNISELYICGLTAEYCVLSTVLDSIKNGFTTYVIKDAVEGIRQNKGDFEDAFTEMEKAGATIITSEDLKPTSGITQNISLN
ncbi:MAG: nicotinamidase [Ignavibacteriales bacterium CG_4_9_14_3_um_filter_30_11]|nr:MAG: nicotinamidase [Ignavibacteriales bacterium CG_4_9_14_3_um_filter_30_11]